MIGMNVEESLAMTSSYIKGTCLNLSCSLVVWGYEEVAEMPAGMFQLYTKTTNWMLVGKGSTFINALGFPSYQDLTLIRKLINL